MKPGVVIYRKPPWLHAAYSEGITEEEYLSHKANLVNSFWREVRAAFTQEEPNG